MGMNPEEPEGSIGSISMDAGRELWGRISLGRLRGLKTLGGKGSTEGDPEGICALPGRLSSEYERIDWAEASHRRSPLP